MVWTKTLFFTFLIPLVPAYFYGFEQSKVIAFVFLVSLSGLFWLRVSKKTRWTRIRVVSAIFLLVLILTSALGINAAQSFLGAYPYYQGIFVYGCLFLYSILISESEIDVEKGLVISSVLVSVWALFDGLRVYILNEPIATYSGRVVASFGQPNFYSGFLLISLPFVYSYLSRKGWTALVLLPVSAILISGSKAAIGLLAMLVLVYLCRRLKRSFIWIGGVLAVLILAFTISSIQFSGFIWDQLGNPRDRGGVVNVDSAEKRVYIFQLGVYLAAQRPYGYGLENIQIAYKKFFEDNFGLIYEQNKEVFWGQKLLPPIVLNNLKNIVIDRSHNYPLDLVLFAGLPGFLAWLALVLVLVKSASKKILIPLVLYLVWVQFQNQSIVHLMLFWMLVGLIDKQNSKMIN